MRGSLTMSIALACLVGVLVAACAPEPARGPVTANPDVPAMKGTPWLWTGSTITGAESIPDPSKYTITLSTDGTFSAQVDCNQVSGTFTVTDYGDVNIKPGPSTRAQCPEPSLADIFLAGLSGATKYQMAADGLVLTGPDGSMTFSPTPPAS
jgi:heat shock protein HslJ